MIFPSAIIFWKSLPALLMAWSSSVGKSFTANALARKLGSLLFLSFPMFLKIKGAGFPSESNFTIDA